MRASVGVLADRIAAEVEAQGEAADILLFDRSDEYDMLDDFSRRTMRIKVVAVEVGEGVGDDGLREIVRQVLLALRGSGVLMERLFYRVEGKLLTVWGMEAL